MRLDHTVGRTGAGAVQRVEAGDAPLPSVRVCEDSIIDLMPLEMASGIGPLAKFEGSAGHSVNHVCLALSQSEYSPNTKRWTGVFRQKAWTPAPG